MDVNKLINWAAGVAESGIRRLPWALFLHPFSLFLLSVGFILRRVLWLWQQVGGCCVPTEKQEMLVHPGPRRRRGRTVSEQLPDLGMRIVFLQSEQTFT